VYKELADATPGVSFVGRLATYRYYDMDQVVGQALATFEKIPGARAIRPVAAGRAPSSRSVAPASSRVSAAEPRG